MSGERRPALGALLAVVVFTVVLSTACQDALFLASHPRQSIPPATLVASLLTAAATVGTRRALRRFAPGPALRAILILIAAGSAAMALWNRSPGPGSTLALFLFVEVATTMGAAATYAWLQAPLSPSAMRRIMPWLGVWSGAGGLMASLAVPLFTRFAPAQALVWLSALGWLVAAALVRSDHQPSPSRARRSRRSQPEGLLSVLRRPLLRWMALGGAGILWVALVSQYQLRVALQESLPPPAIARTMALLLGASSVLGIALQAFVTPRVLERFGVGVALGTLPAVLLTCLGLYALIPVLLPVAAAFLADKALRGNLHRAAEACLIGALPPSVRPTVSLALGGVIGPVLRAVGALVLWGAASLGRPWLIGSALAAAAALVLFAHRWSSLYAQTLRATLDEGRVDAPHEEPGGEALVPVIDGPRLAELLKAIDTGSRRSRELALELLVPHRAAMVARAMTERVRSPYEAVRVVALRWHAAEPAEVLPAVLRERWAGTDASPAERVALLEAAGPRAVELLADDAARWLATDAASNPRARSLEATPLAPSAAGGVRTRGPSLWTVVRERPRMELRAAVIAALFRSPDGVPDEERRSQAARALATMLRAPLADERVLALELVRRLRVEAALSEVLARLDDPELEVRRAAIGALSALAQAQPRSVGPGGGAAARALWSSLRDAALAPAAVRALAEQGEPVVPGVTAALAALRPVGDPHRVLLLRVLGLVPSEQGVAALLAGLGHPEAAVRLEALRALNRVYRDDPELPIDRARVRSLLLDELSFGLGLLRIREALGRLLHRRSLLGRELAAQLDASQQRASRALALLSPPETMVRVFRSLRSPHAPDREAARELLRTVLPAGPLREGASRLLDEESAWTPACAEPPLSAAPLASPQAAIAQLVASGDSALAAALRHDPSLGALALPLHPGPAEGPQGRTEDPMTASIETLLFLKDVALFEALNNAELLEVARLAEPHEAAAGEVLFRQGQPADYLYLVASGKLRVLRDHVEVARLGPGECVGEMAVLGGTDRSATVEATGPCRLLRFDGEDFLALLDIHPEIGRALLRTLVRRLGSAARAGDDRVATANGLIQTAT